MVAPRFPRMSLRATFTIVVSTISSRAQRMAVIVMMARLEPYSTSEACCCIVCAVYISCSAVCGCYIQAAGVQGFSVRENLVQVNIHVHVHAWTKLPDQRVII